MFILDDFLSLGIHGEVISSIRGKVIGTSEFCSNGKNIYIDTCFTNDTRKYETAISINNDRLIVVEDYDTPEKARIGHNSWIKFCEQPSFTLKSIQYNFSKTY